MIKIAICSKKVIGSGILWSGIGGRKQHIKIPSSCEIQEWVVKDTYILPLRGFINGGSSQWAKWKVELFGHGTVHKSQFKMH